MPRRRHLRLPPYLSRNRYRHQVVAPKPKLVLEKPRPKARPTPPKPQVTPPVQPQPASVAKAAEPAPVAAPSAPAAPSFSPANNAASKAAKQSWQSQLLRHLARYKRYPEHARRRGIEGTSQVRFSLDGQGRVLSVALAKSSGNAAIDSATLAMIRRASPVPKPPAELLQQRSSGRCCAVYLQRATQLSTTIKVVGFH